MRVTLDNLPVPVLGTFWPYSADPQTPLISVTAGRRRVTVERTPMSVREMLEANLGAEVTLSEGSNRYHGKIIGVPARSSEEIVRTSPLWAIWETLMAWRLDSLAFVATTPRVVF